MAENNKKPRIRFKGFTEAWEQRKFNNFFEERNERSGDGELISVTINSGIKKFSELNRFDTKPEDMSKYKVVKENDIAYNSMRMWQGASGLSPYNGILSPAYTVITPKANVSSLFFSYQIKKPQMIHLFEINSQGLTKDTWNLKFVPFSQIDTSAPKSFDEQQKIGSLFKDLDNLITLHQRKYDKLLNVKKALLDKMFPKNGKNIPEIRFKGFTEAWEQRKFIDLLDFERPDNYMVSDDHYENDGIPVLTANKAFVLGYKNENGAYNKGNCVIFDDFTLDSKFVDFPFKINSSAIKILTAKHNNNLKFIYYLLSSSNILMQGHARHYISIVQPFVTSVPKIQEQNKIECMISDLDNLITLHQRECEKLKNVKKSLLEKMFV